MKVTKKEQKKEKDPRQQDISPAEHRAVSLRDAMNKLFDESFWDPFENFPTLGNWQGVFPRLDISETDKEIKIDADVPGVDADNIEIEVDEDSLIISGKTEKEEENDDEKVYRYEREYGEFAREVALPAKVDPDNVKAKVKKGVLRITLPKIEEEKKKKVKVEDEE